MEGKTSSGARCARRGEGFAEALAIYQQLRSIFESSKGGAKDLRTLHRVRELCTKASRSLSDSVCRDRLGQLQNLADALFSDRRNQQWARNRSTSGVPSLRYRTRATLEALHGRLTYMMAARKSSEGAASRERRLERAFHGSSK